MRNNGLYLSLLVSFVLSGNSFQPSLVGRSRLDIKLRAAPKEVSTHTPMAAAARSRCYLKEFTVKPATLSKAVDVLRNHVWLGEAGGIGPCTVVRPPSGADKASLVGQVRKIGGMFPYYEEVVKWDTTAENDTKFCMQYKLVDGGGDDRRSPSWPIVNHLSTVIMTAPLEKRDEEEVHVQWKVEHDSSWWFTPLFHLILNQNVGVSVPKTFQHFVKREQK